MRDSLPCRGNVRCGGLKAGVCLSWLSNNVREKRKRGDQTDGSQILEALDTTARLWGKGIDLEGFLKRNKIITAAKSPVSKLKHLFVSMIADS